MSKGKISLAIDSELADQARDLNIDASAVAELALAHEIHQKRTQVERDEAARKWQEENAEAIAWSNKYFEDHGFPFPQYRLYCWHSTMCIR